MENNKRVFRHMYGVVRMTDFGIVLHKQNVKNYNLRHFTLTHDVHIFSLKPENKFFSAHLTIIFSAFSNYLSR